MTPTFLFLLLILSMTEVSLNAPIDNEDENENEDQYMDNSENIPRPKMDMKNFMLLDDIVLPDPSSRNADPCTAIGCKWPKTGRYVYVPYYISPVYNSTERNIIMTGLQSFRQPTCIRFVPWKSGDRDYIHFVPKDGCSSKLGRQNGGQEISLDRDGCVNHGTVQHEILHALGFHHEQNRSDRDQYVWILFQNVKPKQKHNFKKVETNNLRTPYDFSSIMQYPNDAFSKNGKDTIVAKHDPYLVFGHAERMSINDIIRVNRLYKC